MKIPEWGETRMRRRGRQAVVATMLICTGLVTGTAASLHAASSSGVEWEGTGNVSFPGPLQHLPGEPVGLGVFGGRIVFPLFSPDGASSAIVAYDSKSAGLTRYLVPKQIQDQVAYAAVADEKRGVLWVGTEKDLVGFSVTGQHIQVEPLPGVEYPFSAPWEVGPGGIRDYRGNVLGLALDKRHDVWITRDHDSGVTKFDPETGRFYQYPLPQGVVPKAIAALSNTTVAVNVYHTDNPQYMLGEGNLDTGTLVVHVLSGQTVFTPGETLGLVEGGSGKVVMMSRDGLGQVDPTTGGKEALQGFKSYSMSPGLTISSRDGSTWVASGGEVDHILSGKMVRYGIPAWSGCCGHGQPMSGSVAGKTVGNVSLDPDVTAVAAGADGDAWFVAAGYNSIGHITP